MGREHLTIIDAVGKVSQKPKISWSNVEDEASLGNSRALNVIFNEMDQNAFKLINTCTYANEGWSILEVAYEGTFKVKISRLQPLTSKFEALKMSEDEFIADFNVHVQDIAIESFALGEKISDTKLV